MIFRRVLITGANGLLGQALTRRLGDDPAFDVLATARQPEPLMSRVSGGYVPLDITSPTEVRRAFVDFAPDVVVNCAAMTQVDACETDRELCWQVNVDAVETLARNCLSTGAHLVQVSTDFVFDGESGPYREVDRPAPPNFYGKSKLAGENAARGAGIDRWSIARTVLVYGTGENMTRSNFVLWVVDQLSRGQRIRVVTDQFRTPTFADDLAAGIDGIVRYGKSGTFHISGRELLSIYDFALRIARAFDLDPSLIEPTDGSRFRQTAPRPARTGFVILKAETELGYRPTPLDETLRIIRERLHPVETR